MYEYAVREIRNGLQDQEPSMMLASLHSVRPPDLFTRLMHAAAYVSLFGRLVIGLQISWPKSCLKDKYGLFRIIMSFEFT